MSNSDREPEVVMAAVHALTGGVEADVAIEAVGIPATFDLAVELVRPVGRVANIGVHGKPVTLHLERLWDRTSRSLRRPLTGIQRACSFACSPVGNSTLSAS